jgi:hypothetical protein
MKTTIRFFLLLASLSVSVLPKAQAVSPAPDGGYPGGNTAEGDAALLSLTTGGFNTAVGYLSLRSTTTGSFNTAVGAGTLLANTADQNTATGAGALLSNTTGALNTATGAFALVHNTTGADNTAVGDHALENNTTGLANVAIGQGALQNNTTSFFNTALGYGAGLNVTTASNVICIGSNGANVSNTTWVGGIWNVNPQSGNTANVVVSDQGQLAVLPSSERFKKDIQSMDKASESILALKPVTFRYKTQKNATPQFGLIAEEVAAVNPDLVVRDKEGKPYSVRYDQVNAMLLNEFLKEHRTVQGQKAIVAQLKQDFQSRLAEQQKQIEALTAGLQKVSAQLEASKPAPQVVNNP